MNKLELLDFGMLYGTIIIFIFRYKQLDIPFRQLIFFLLILAIGNTLAIYIFEILRVENNLFLFHYLAPLEYIALCIVFYNSLESRTFKKAIIISIPGFVLLCVFLSMYVDGLSENNSNARIVEALLVTIWILLYFRQLSTTDKILHIKRNPLFWVYIGLMFYFLGTLFLQGLLNYIIETFDKNLAHKFYISLQVIFECLLLLAINIGLLCHKIFKTQ